MRFVGGGVREEDVFSSSSLVSSLFCLKRVCPNQQTLLVGRDGEGAAPLRVGDLVLLLLCVVVVVVVVVVVSRILVFDTLLCTLTGGWRGEESSPAVGFQRATPILKKTLACRV